MNQVINGNISMIVASISILLSIILLFLYLNLKKRISALSKDSTGKSLEDLIIEANRNSTKAINTGEIYFERLKKIEKKFEKAYTKSALIRYNPFKDVGGNQSFSLCLLDYHNSGVIISALYHQGQSSIYVREIQDGTPSIELSQEEIKVFKKALEQIN